MVCQKCKSQIPDGVSYCPVCQCPTGIVPTPATPSRRCPQCGAAVRDTLSFCPNCGCSMNQTSQYNQGNYDDAVNQTTQLAPKRKKAKIRTIIMGTVAILMVVVLVAGLLTNWFGLTGPGNRIASAVGKTIDSGSFTVDIEMVMKEEYSDGVDTEKIEGTAQVIFEPDKRELTLYAELESEGEWTVVAIYDGFLIRQNDYNCYKTDISDDLDAFFDVYEETASKDFSWEDFLDQIMGKGTYDEAQEYVDFDELSQCCADYAKKLNDQKWLKKNAGYSTKKEDGVTKHCFNPDVYVFLDESSDMFEKAFVEEDDFQSLKDELRDNKRGLRDFDVELAIGIKGGKLVELEFEGSADYETLSASMKFKDIGKTDIDEGDLESLFKKAVTY